ncbi:phage baseplate protein [Streptomyces justiciae]|uniref:phage baseplate protein n=1 Tax=Streptomyces justiciae TaxID=2780140 RepID=UPI002117FCAF|nr:hypothetical protein [Streptomyces justiciae]MCW8375588.1 hypothetical protein [Streptomyces justiciae]
MRDGIDGTAGRALRGPSRRGLLRGGAGLAAAAAVGTAAPLIAAGTAQAVVPASQHFVLSGNGGNPVWRATLHQPYWAMQSFAYDNVNGRIYFAQHRIGDSAGHNGDLWISQTDLSGNVLGAMAIQGFGHGSSMGVEPTGSGSTPYLWIEGGDSDDNGAGETLARFRFTDGLTLEYFNPSITIYDRTPTISSFVKLPRPAIDPSTNRLLIRYATSDSAARVWRLAVFDMADAVAGRLSDGYRLVERAIPNNDELGLTDADLFQGITLCGQYAYLTYGGPSGPSYLVTLDLNATGGSYYDKFETTAGASLPGREPQGAAVWMVSGAPRLAFGFSSKTTSTDPDTLDASVFYKSDLAS